MTEQWKVIAAYPNYAVSDHGRIKRLSSRTCGKADFILATPSRSGQSYLAVDLCAAGGKKTFAVHRLVAEAFLGPAPFLGAEVNHLDGNKANAAASNLEWSTSSANKLHAYRCGLSRADGEHNGQAKLTWDCVNEIRARSIGRRGEQAELARKYGVSAATIRDVIHRRTWAA